MPCWYCAQSMNMLHHRPAEVEKEEEERGEGVVTGHFGSKQIES